MEAWGAFWLGVILGPIIWAAGVVICKLAGDLIDNLERRWGMRKWDKDQKRKYKLEKELEKLNGREY